MNSLQARVNAKSVAVTRPGRASGSTIRQSALSRVQPSTRALSSRSRGMLDRWAVNIQVMNGTMKAGYVTMSDQRVFDK